MCEVGQTRKIEKKKKENVKINQERKKERKRVVKLRQKEREEGNIERRKEIMKEKICFIPLKFYLCNAGAIGHDFPFSNIPHILFSTHQIEFLAYFILNASN